MLKSNIRLLIAVAALLSISSVSGTAQSSQSCTGTITCTVNNNNWPCYPVPPPGAVMLFDCGPGCAVLGFKTNACYLGNPESCPTCASAGHPINLANGNTFIEQTDVSLPGIGGGLSLVRTWNSVWPPSLSGARVGAFGNGWRSTYEERVFVGSDGYYKYARADGSVWSFGFAAGVGETATTVSFQYITASPSSSGGGAGASLVVTLANTQQPLQSTLTFGNGEKRVFDNTPNSVTLGNLVAIVDRNGNTTQISYDSNGRLASVADAVRDTTQKRHLYFHYDYTATPRLVSSVTSDFGIGLSYHYDAQSRLDRVTRPDNSVITFEFDGGSNITAVKDQNGKILESHTYDLNSGRGLTSSQADGISGITITYPQ